MKKLILPSIFTFIAILLLNFLTPSPASAFFHNKGSLNEFDCQKYWEDLSEGDRLTIGGPTSGNKSDWKFSSNKEALTKASGGSCDIGGIHYDTDSEGEAKNGFEINISYFPNQEEARAKLSSLKAAEPAAVEEKNVSGDTYSMRTVKLDSEERREHFLASGNFGRTVGRVGNCVVSLTHTWYALAYQFNTGDEYDQQVDLMDVIMDGTKQGWQILSEAKDLQRFCGGKAELGKPSTQSPPPSPQVSNKDEGNLAETKSPAQAINDWIIETLGVYEPQVEFENVPEEGWRTPTITTRDEQEAWALLKSKEESDVAVVKGQGQLQPLDSGLVRIWGYDAPTQKFGFYDPTLNKTTQDLKRMLKLNKGEIEVKIKNANSKEKFGVQTEFLDLIVIQTHFWVSHDPDKKQTVVGVYEGEVEVTPRGSNKSIRVSPNGDRPGVVVITQKLSVIKLAVAGLVVVVVLVGVILFARKRFALRGRGKKR